MPFIVAIDGPAGTGKGTITKLVAQDLGLLNVDTGALYRCVTLEVINRKLNLENKKEIIELMDEINIQIKNNNGEQTIYLNEKDVTDNIRKKEVNDLVSEISNISEVRQKITKLERGFGKKQDIIMEGRDISTHVFPNADIKIYLDATPEERAKRRLLQNQEKGIDIPYEEILHSINKRDENDKNRKEGPLKLAEDAILIDTTNMTIDEVKKEVEKIINNKYNKKIKNQEIKKTSIKKDAYKQTKVKLIIRKIIKILIYLFYCIIYRVKVLNKQNIPKTGAYIICANHVKLADPPALVVTAKRHINMIAKEELFHNPFLAWLGYIFDVIPVKRGVQDIEAMKRSLQVLKNDELLALYPEGTRNGLKKNNGKVKNGAAFIAARTGVPVIPVGIKGSFKPFTKVIINYGEPLDFSRYQSKQPEKENLEKISKEIMDNIIRLTNE